VGFLGLGAALVIFGWVMIKMAVGKEVKAAAEFRSQESVGAR
jgi:hypothetical protein